MSSSLEWWTIVKCLLTPTESTMKRLSRATFAGGLLLASNFAWHALRLTTILSYILWIWADNITINRSHCLLYRPSASKQISEVLTQYLHCGPTYSPLQIPWMAKQVAEFPLTILNIVAKQAVLIKPRIINSHSIACYSERQYIQVSWYISSPSGTAHHIRWWNFFLIRSFHANASSNPSKSANPERKFFLGCLRNCGRTVIYLCSRLVTSEDR